MSAAAGDILAQLDPFPAAVLSRRHDILGYNRAFNAMAGDLDAIDPAKRNQIWLFFVNPYWRRRLFRDRRETVHHLVGSLRASMAAHLDDPAWTTFVDQLLAVSDEFAELWRRHDVVDQVPPARDFLSPAGDLRLTSTKFALEESEATWMVVFSPRDGDTRRRLEELVTRGAKQLKAV
ncbi:MmyB family transcriptional regulator [Streptomyces malaysiensis]|uniref:MmyB-like transcription regulator ligand binding domain-containing protein n=1 Tax=Streptomyces malaysiensis subsp. samsunensis TaxID=459658 RepID=A0A9X2M4Z6_STRMQ|nr:hypothetical protein [Streptomyces samsunensis]MCQ8835477.1 hypothetical protein [Streptomyces samsunensis]